LQNDFRKSHTRAMSLAWRQRDAGTVAGAPVIAASVMRFCGPTDAMLSMPLTSANWSGMSHLFALLEVT
jgi:hypothetical protein